MGIFKAIGKTLVQAAEFRGHRLAQQQLLNMSDSQLEDFGISRLKLLEGVSAWPWAVESVDDQGGEIDVTVLKPAPMVINVAKKVRDAREVRQAINELHSYSDRELAELGVARQSIEEAVRFGRPAIEGAAHEQSRVA